MPIYWFFDLQGVAERCRLLTSSLYATEHFSEVREAIALRHRGGNKTVRRRGTIPS
jgi:hypothetical protein